MGTFFKGTLLLPIPTRPPVRRSRFAELGSADYEYLLAFFGPLGDQKKMRTPSGRERSRLFLDLLWKANQEKTRVYNQALMSVYGPMRAIYASPWPAARGTSPSGSANAVFWPPAGPKYEAFAWERNRAEGVRSNYGFLGLWAQKLGWVPPAYS